MKRVLVKNLILSFAMALISACGGANNSNLNGQPGYCVPGQVCVASNLPPGAVAKLGGYLTNVNDSAAQVFGQIWNYVASSSGITYSDSNIQITAQGMPNGSTGYFVEFFFRPRPSGGMAGCVTYGPPNSCYNPIYIAGMANLSINAAGQQELMMVYSPGIKFRITGSAPDTFSGASANPNISIKLVGNGQDPVNGGSQLANSVLYRYN